MTGGIGEGMGKLKIIIRQNGDKKEAIIPIELNAGKVIEDKKGICIVTYGGAQRLLEMGISNYIDSVRYKKSVRTYDIFDELKKQFEDYLNCQRGIDLGLKELNLRLNSDGTIGGLAEGTEYEVIKEKDKQKVIDGLKDLIRDRESFITADDPDSIFVHDKLILEEAIKTIEENQPHLEQRKEN